METRYGELESAATVQKVLDAYDRAADGWRSPFDAPFWKAVRHAHSRGRRGRGERVALIDSGCDLSIPRLRRCVSKTQDFVPGLTEGDPIGHGTAVALLVTEVAPEASLDMYRVTDGDGRVDLAATHDAIRAATQTDATVINLSLGDRRPIVSASGDRKLPDASTDPDEFKQLFAGENPPCRLCQAASDAAKAGKLVFAAVGNSVIDVYCPSRATNVIAVGFQRQERLEPSPGQEIVFGLPVHEEAPYADLFVRQIDGVLGSSFASPLFAGVGALGLKREELEQYVSSFGASALPKRWHGQLATDPKTPPPREMLVETDRHYWDALCRLPHVHSFVHGARRSDLTLTDPADCIFCGFFAEQLYVKLGLWLRDTGRNQDAIALLNAACAFAPWSDESHAFLGGTFYAENRLPQALREIEMAERLRPGHPPYVAALAKLRETASQRR
jgi:hypothetical protein